MVFQAPVLRSFILNVNQSGSAFQIQGEMFSNSVDYLCKIGGFSLRAKWVADNQIDCVFGTLPPGNLSLCVSFSHQSSCASNVLYTLNQFQLAVANVDPAVVLYGRTTVLTLTLTSEIDAQSKSSVFHAGRFVSTAQILRSKLRFEFAPFDTNSATLRILKFGSTVPVFVFDVGVLLPSAIFSVSPQAWFPYGGSLISVLGKDFPTSSVVHCSFSSTKTVARCLSESLCLCQTLLKVSSVVTFSLSSGGITISNELELQPFTAAINLTHIVPALAPLVQGNASVTIFGSGFSLGIQYFGLIRNVLRVPGNVQGSALILKLPVIPLGNVSVQIILGDGSILSSQPIYIENQPLPKISHVLPSIVSVLA
jgi:hypothetical protein